MPPPHPTAGRAPVPRATPRLLVRAFTPADGPLVHQLVGDPEVMRHLQGGAVPLDRVTSEVLTPMLALAAELPGHGRFCLEDRVTGGFVGWVSLVPRVPDDGPVYGWAQGARGSAVLELGFRLVRRAWGRGLATEAAHAAVDHASAVLGARTLVATTMAVNTGSCRVLERVGFVRTAVHVLDWLEPNLGAEHGEAEYRLDLLR